VPLRLLAEVAWQPIGIAVAYGVWIALGREGTRRVVQVLGTASAFVALAWLPVAAIDLAARTRHDARLTEAQLASAGAHSRSLVEAVTRLRALIPAGDTYELDAYSGRILFWAHNALLPRVAVGPGEDAQWRVVWRGKAGGTGPPGARELAPGVWVARAS
jgi:hypothetical protein